MGEFYFTSIYYRLFVIKIKSQNYHYSSLRIILSNAMIYCCFQIQNSNTILFYPLELSTKRAKVVTVTFYFSRVFYKFSFIFMSASMYNFSFLCIIHYKVLIIFSLLYISQHFCFMFDYFKEAHSYLTIYEKCI